MKRELAIYPTARKVEDLLKRQSLGQRVLLDHRIITFPELTDRLARDLGLNRPVVSDSAERLILESAFATLSEQAAALLSPYAGRPHTDVIVNLRRLIREFESAALTPDDLCRATAGLNPAEALRVRALAEVFSAYESVLDRAGLADRRGRERALVAALLKCEAGDERPAFLASVTRMLVAEIYDFSLLEILTISSLIRIIGEARLTIQAQPRSVDVSSFTDLTWNRFVENEEIADLVLPEFINRGGRSGRLGLLVQRIFTDGAADAETPAPDDDTVEMFIATDPEREIEEVARQIRQMLEGPEEARIGLDRIAIISRDHAAYRDHIGRVFHRRGIPVRIQSERLLGESPAARIALAILTLAQSGYRREGLCELIGSLWPPSTASKLRASIIESGYLEERARPLGECFDNLIRRCELEAGADQDHTRKAGIEGKIRRAIWARGWLLRLLQSLKHLESAATVEQHSARLRQILASFGYCAGPGDSGRHSARWLGEAARTIEVLDQLAADARLTRFARRLEAAEFASLVAATIAETAVPEKSMGAATLGNAVRTCSVLDARGLDFDLVFMVGLLDGVFPRHHSDDPLLPDRLRRVINRPLAASLRQRFPAMRPFAKALRTRRDYNNEERFLFFLGLSTANRRIVLSWPASNGQGAPTLVSPFAAEAAALLGMSPENGGIGRAAIASPAGSGTRDFVCAGALNSDALGNSQNLASIAQRIRIEHRRQRYFALPTREKTRSAASVLAKLELADRYSGRVGAGERLRTLLMGTPENPRAWSTGDLSSLASCGFKFFAERVLRLAKEEAPEPEASAIEKGDLVHRVLHQLMAEGLDFGRPDRAREQARENLAGFHDLEADRARDPQIFEVQWRELERIVDEFVDWEAAQRRGGQAFTGERLLEHRFDLELRDEPANAEIGRLLVRGRIDRLETDADGEQIKKIRVIDYKNSREPSRYTALLDSEREFGITGFQLPIYLTWAVQRYGDRLAPEAAIEAAFMILRNRKKFFANKKKYDSMLFALDPPDESTIAGRIMRIVHTASAGIFDIDPLKCDKFCPYRAVCRIGRMED